MVSLIESFKELFSETFEVFTAGYFLVIYQYLILSAPVWLPIILTVALWFVWIDYVRSRFIASQHHILLEIKLPPDVSKSPLAMETVLTNLHFTTGESTWYDRYILGKTRAWFSFEIVSIEGSIHFFIWTREVYKNIIESQLYGQYPNVEIQAVADYTDYAPYFDKERIAAWGNNFVLTKEDPYPIKTYVDFGLDRDPKEEFKIDPLTTVLEYFATLGKGEQAWLQILVQAHKSKRRGGSFQSTDWQEEGREVIKKLQADFRKSDETDKEGKPTFRFPTKGETDLLAAIDRSISKLGFDVGMKLIYLAEKDKFVGGRIPTFLNIMKAFNSNNLNGFKPSKYSGFDFPWQDFNNIRVNVIKAEHLAAYRRRSYFHAPYKEKPFVLNTEELATIFHLPGGVLQTPSINRVASRKGSPPSNLPA